jgi:acyl-CoA thioester hydrolase
MTESDMANFSPILSSTPGPAPLLDDFVSLSSEKLRYRDTDPQGHVNNAVFSTFLETGRVELLFTAEADLAGPDGRFVLAHLTMDFRKEAKWPGEVEIGTRIVTLGRSSLRFEQAVFQHGFCIATAETIVVLTDVNTRRSRPFSDKARAFLERKTRKL